MNIINKEKQIDGRKWENIGPYNTFEDCKKHLETLMTKVLSPSEFDVKIKHLEDGFFIKTRKNKTAFEKEKKVLESALKEQEKVKAENKKDHRNKRK